MLKKMSEKYSDLQQTHSACAEQQEYIDEKLEEVDMLTNQLKVKEEECVALVSSENVFNNVNIIMSWLSKFLLLC